ncbi:MAG: head GIN domain-containing protein [Nannocystaceae bacterium]
MNRPHPQAPRLLLAFVFAFAAPLAGCGDAVRGDGDAAEDPRAVASFTQVANATNLEVQVAVSDEARVVVSCDRNLLEHIETSVDDGTLHIKARDGAQLRPQARCVVDVATPHLTGLRNAGSGSLNAQGPAPELASVQASGSGSLTAAGLAAPSVSVSGSGSGAIKVAGEVSTVSLSTTGSGSLDAAELRSEKAEASVSGSGSVTLHATTSVRARTSGSGGVTVHGAPAQRDVKSSGSGQVRFAD